MDMKAKHTLTNEPDLSYENIKVSILYNFSLIIGMHVFAHSLIGLSISTC